MDRETDTVLERIIEYCRRVSQEFKLEKVLLFGSRSRGDFFPYSDIDLLLVSDDFPKDWFKRQARLHFLKSRQIEPIGYTTDEIRKNVFKLEINSSKYLISFLFNQGFEFTCILRH
jgi:predicted nucleotidyltransferase